MQKTFSKKRELAVMIRGITYVWQEHINTQTLAKKQALSYARKIVFIVFSVFALVFFGLFFYKNWSFLFFLGLLCLQFLFVHTHRHKRKPSMPTFSQKGEVPKMVETDGKETFVNIQSFFDEEAEQAVEQAYTLALRFHHSCVEPIHIFLGCLSTQKAAAVFYRLGLSFSDIKESLQKHLHNMPSGEETVFQDKAKKLLLTAFLSAYQASQTNITSLALLEASYEQELFLQELLYRHTIEKKQFEQVIEWIRIQELLQEQQARFQKAAAHKPTGAINRAMTSIATPVLDQVSDDLTTQAVYGRLPMLIGREQELRELFRILEGGGKSVLLVGPSGVGKEALIHGVAAHMVEEAVPDILKDKRLVQISLPHLLAAGTQAQIQERLLLILQEIGKSKNIVMVLTDIEQIAGPEQTELAALLVDALHRRFTFVLATTTPQAYAEQIEHGILGQALQPIHIKEPEPDQAIAVLESKMGWIEAEQGVLFSFAALEACVALSHRYLHEAFLPEKAIEIAKETALFVKQKGNEGAMVTKEDVEIIISEKSHVPVSQVEQAEKEILLHLEKRIHNRVIGQDHAVTAVSNALRRARADLASQDRPLANFLFLGPTGVGKTELAKTLAEVYFGGEQNMLRFDMSEYQNKESLFQLLGKPGETKGGLLTEAVRKQPFSLLLFDELEKAHPDILHIFLQLMDDGRLTDVLGQTVDFTNTILIATSNAGTAYIQEEVRKRTPLEQIKTGLLEKELQEYYRPEFLNRFDEVIIFEPLTLDAVTQIAYLFLEEVRDHLDAKGIHFEIEDQTVSALAKKGFDPLYGARPLRRVIQDEVDNAIAKTLLEGDVQRGDTLFFQQDGMIEIKKASEF